MRIIIFIIGAALLSSAVFGADEAVLESAFTKAAAKVGPSVVTITMERTRKVSIFGPGQYYFKGFGSKDSPNEFDPMEQFFREFFGELPEREFRQQGLGSGVIIDKDGYILTNQHVIEGADKITVILPDGRSFNGEVRGEDRRSDLAVLRIDAIDLPYAELGDSDSLKTGQWAIAIGNPFGHIVRSPQPTVTAGVISALHRSLPFSMGYAERNYRNMIQTDAAINQGNSGGPLCDLDGKVIGINVAIFSQTGGNIGIGFAIPVNTAKAVLGDLIKGKDVIYGWFGILAQDITQDVADYFNLPDNEGALIAEVIEGSPAQKGGLKAGDIIKAYNEKSVKDAVGFSELAGQSKVGEKVSLKVIRDRREMIIRVTVEERPREGPEAARMKESPQKPEINLWRGMKVSSITYDLADRLNLKDRSGVVIIETAPNSPAYNIGLKSGDVIKEINRISISDENDYRRVTAAITGRALLRTNKGYFIIKDNE